MLPMRLRAAALRRVLVPVVALAVLALGAPRALAAPAPTLAGTFAGSGSADGQLSAPHGVAVDPTTGHVFVADGGNGRIEEYAADGTFVAAITSHVAHPYALAVDPGNGWLYETDGSAGDWVVNKFALGDGSFVAQIGSYAGPGSAALLYGIAVDPQSGDVYVADNGQGAFQQVDEYDSAGTFVRSIGSMGDGTNGTFSSSSLEGVAVDSKTNELWVAAGGALNVFSLSGTYLRQYGLDGITGNSGGHYDFLAADPSTGHLFVSTTDSYDQETEIAPDGTAVEHFTLDDTAYDSPAGVVAGPNGDLYVAGTDGSAFHYTEALPPAVTAVGVTQLSSTAATLSLTVNPKDAATDWHVEYMQNGQTSPDLTPTQHLIAGHVTYTPTVAIGAAPGQPGALRPDTDYYWRVVATSANGTATSSLLSFHTPAATSGPTAAARYRDPLTGQTLFFPSPSAPAPQFRAGSSVAASFGCTPSTGATLTSCTADAVGPSGYPKAFHPLGGSPSGSFQADLPTAYDPACHPGTACTYTLTVSTIDSAQQHAQTDYRYVVLPPATPSASGNYVDPATGAIHSLDGARFTLDDTIPLLYGCAAGTGSTIRSCSVKVTGPAARVVNGTRGGRLILPSSKAGAYEVTVVAENTDGQTAGHSYRYTVDAPPSAANVSANQGQDASAAAGAADHGILGGGLVDEWRTVTYKGAVAGYLDKTSGTLLAAPGFDVVKGPFVVDSSGKVIAAGAGNVVAGSGDHVIAAGAGNVIALVGNGVIAAGAGNVIAAGAGNIVAIAAGKVIAAGAGNVIAAGAGNLVSDKGLGLTGTGLSLAGVIAAGAGNVIAAGAGNFGYLHGAGLGAAQAGGVLGSSSLVSDIAGNGLLSLSGSSVIGAGAGNLLGTTASVAAAHRRKAAHPVIGTARVVFARAHHRTRVVFVATAAGRRILARLAALNAQRRRHHQKLVRLRLTLTYEFTPRHGKRVTVTRTLTVAPVAPKRRR